MRLTDILVTDSCTVAGHSTFCRSERNWRDGAFSGELSGVVTPPSVAEDLNAGITFRLLSFF